MNQYITGSIIKELREKINLTQGELAQKLCVSDKTVSKWETAKGYPDISLLEPIAKVFGISVTELLSGSTIRNINVSANMLCSKFYVCPACGNIMHCMGEAVIQCHGVQLVPCQPEETDENHMIFIEKVEDEYFVRIEHDMTKEHYISFVTLEGGVVLQTLETWKAFVGTDKVILPNNAGELYFEEYDMDNFCNHLKAFEISYVHELFEHRWGQRVVRFYDPDKHIIEVGERLDSVVLRFIEQGLSAEETAVRMDIHLDFVVSCLNK